MTKVPTIHIEHKSSDWVRVESANALPLTYKFMRENKEMFSRVGFGDRGVNGESYASKLNEVVVLLKNAKSANVSVFWKQGEKLIDALPSRADIFGE